MTAEETEAIREQERTDIIAYLHRIARVCTESEGDAIRAACLGIPEGRYRTCFAPREEEAAGAAMERATIAAWVRSVAGEVGRTYGSASVLVIAEAIEKGAYRKEEP